MISRKDLLNRWVRASKSFPEKRGGLSSEELDARRVLRRKRFRKIKERVADKLGYPFVLNREKQIMSFDKYQPAWDGKVGRIDIGDPDTFVHEIAHWQVATEKRRKLVEFGLGPPGGFSSDGSAPRTVSMGYAETEERRASFLGILWLDKLYLNPMQMAWDHQWAWLDTHRPNWNNDAGESRHVDEVLRWLHRHGLIDENAMPLYEKR